MSPWLLHQAFEEAAARFPQSAAVVGGGAEGGETVWTYAELETGSRALALALRQAGLPLGARVGVWMRKSPAAVGALLGILRAGGVYVPLDPAAPTLRIATLAANAGLWGLFADADLARAAQAWPHPPRLLSAAARPGVAAGALAPAPLTGLDLAYILYTSGSTGTPKGVMLTHAHALNFIGWAAAEVGLRAGDQVSSHAPFHFDLSVFDLWASLGCGATVHLLDAVTARFARASAEWIAARGITVWYSVPGALVAMLPHVAVAGDSLRAIAFAGEVFPGEALKAWRRALPNTSFHNWYGPTETNVCTGFRLTPATPPEATPDPLPIGTACANFSLAVRDRRGRPVAPGQPGFLWASGPGVLAGYWGDRERTRRVLRRLRHPDADPAALPQRWYNTGDRVAQNERGEFVFLGRRDDLVKLRGYRISLLEVAAALESCPGVERAAVLVERPAGQPARLLAYIAGAGLEAGTVRRHAAQHLPAYMLPERIEVRASLPLTSTGKLDRRGLAAAIAAPSAS